ISLSKDCDDEDGCEQGSRSEDRIPKKELLAALEKDNPPVAAFTGEKHDNNNGGPSYEIVSMSTRSKENDSSPLDAFTTIESSESSSNKGSSEAIYEIISQSIEKGNKELSNEDCDDEDDCGSADGVFSNDGSGDEGVKGLSPPKDKDSEKTAYYEVISKSMVGKDDSTPTDAFSTGKSSNISSNEGNEKVIYEIISTSLEKGDKDKTPTDTFTNEESSGNGPSEKRNGDVIYEIISKSLTNGNKEVPKKDCDDEDECGSADDVFIDRDDVPKGLAPPKEKNGSSEKIIFYEVISKTMEKKDNLTDVFTAEKSSGSSIKKENDGVTYEIISKSMEPGDKISKKSCDDEDECGRVDDVFVNEGSGYKTTNGQSPSKDKDVPGGTKYEIISTSMEKKDVPSNKNCDDEDECGSADDVFTNDGSGDNEKNVPSGKPPFYEVMSKEIVKKEDSSPKDTFGTEDNDDAKYEIIFKSTTTESKKSQECGNDDEDCQLPNSGSGDDTFNARRTYSPPKFQLEPQVSVESSLRPLFRDTSFLELPPLGKDAQDSIEAELEILPLEGTGILLYNGWERNKIGDFISLSIQDGFPELSFDCRSGPVKIRTLKSIKMYAWNKIKFFRTGRLGSLTLNDDHSAMALSPEPRSALTLNRNLMVGGISEEMRSEVDINVGFHKGFTGYIRNLKIQGKEVDLNSIPKSVKKNPCLSSRCEHDGQCVQDGEGYSCLCKAQYRGRHCSEEIDLKPISFHKDSYVRFNKAALMKILQGEDGFVMFSIRTTQPKGLLMWEAQKLSQHFQRYVTVGLTVGFVSLSFNFGTGKRQFYSNIPVDDGKWHNVTVARNEGSCSLTIDEKHKTQFSSSTNGLSMRTAVDLYIGGIPSIKSATKGLHKIGFKGCLKNVQINSKFLDFDRDYIASQGTGHCSDT
ncbi:pikachurin isoform X2, partial [Paramuricea clavata]